MRTFIAIEIPEPIRASLDCALATLRSGLEHDLVRWVKPGSMHLTLKFLGEIERQQVNSVQEILEEAAVGFSRFVLEVEGFGCFPNGKRPRVLWVGFESAGDDLLQLQADLESRLEKIGFEGDRRAYHPHLTVGRVRKGLSGADIQVIAGWAQDAQLGTVGKFEVESINLIRSVLKPSGAEYTQLHAARLAA
ncbi:MAG: RNA 2',3'-cyclic phosphodiesterase [Anaerolineae bacterium]|nr:MAG: RNA 2',3'-cyclic phosphodiesterase [Anaerolineae bacterium]